MLNKLFGFLRKSTSPERGEALPAQPADDKLIQSLQKLSLLKDTPPPVLQKIAARARFRDLSKGEMLVRQGDTSDSLFIIRRGWVKIVAEGSSGEEVVLKQCGPGQVIGEMALLDQQPRSNTIVGLSEANVLEIKYEAVIDALNEHPQLALAFLRDMSDRLRFANAYIEETIIWSQHIATGDYDFVQNQVQETQSTIIDISLSDQARASAFLSAFFKMIEGVKKREEKLMQQVNQLRIEIDEVKRQQAVEELTETQFFEQLQETARKLRAERDEKRRRQSEQSDTEEMG
jgi:CRP-like cAMP-binding protein